MRNMLILSILCISCGFYAVDITTFLKNLANVTESTSFEINDPVLISLNSTHRNNGAVPASNDHPTLNEATFLYSGENGIVDSTFGNMSTTVASSASTGKTIIISTAVSCNNLIVPIDTGIKVVPGGSINVADGKVLTINGPFSAGLYQVFYGKGKVVFGPGSVAFVYPEWGGNTTSGWQKMIDSAPVGSVVKFTAASYTITPSLYKYPSGWSQLSGLRPKSGVNLISNGSELVNTTGTEGRISDLIDISNKSDVTISGFIFNRGSVDLKDGARFGIRIANGSTRIKIKNNYFHDCYIGIGHQMEESPNFDIEYSGNTFYRMGNLAIGANQRGGAGIKVINNTFRHCGFSQTSYGGYIGGAVEIRGNNGTLVSNNQFNDLTDNTFPNDAVRVEVISESPRLHGTDNIVSNNIMKNIGGNGVRVICCDRTKIYGNKISNITPVAKGGMEWSGNGILLTPDGLKDYDDGTEITNNEIYTSNVAINSQNGISHNTLIVGNMINTAKRGGINVSLAYGVISNNHVRDIGGNSPIYLQGTGHSHVVGNRLIRGPANGGIEVVSDYNTIENNYIVDDREKIVHNYGIKVYNQAGNIIRNNTVNGFNIKKIFLTAGKAFNTTNVDSR